MGDKKRKRGRPKKTISREMYVSGRLLELFSGYLLEKLSAELEVAGLIRGDMKVSLAFAKHEGPRAKKDDGTDYAMTTPFTTEAEKIAFSNGIQMALEIIEQITFPEFLRYAMTKYGLTLNISQIIRDQQESEKRTERRLADRPKKAREAWHEFMELVRKNTRLPNDILRKVRKPNVSKKQILQLRSAVLDSEGYPYVDEIAMELGLDVNELMLLVQEANRQRIKVDIGEHKGKKILVVND